MTGFRKKLIINSGIIFVVFIVVVVSLYVIISKIDKVSTGILALKAETHTAELQSLAFASLKEDSQKAVADLAVMRQVLPLRDDLPDFRVRLETLARGRNLRSGFSFGAESAGDQGTLGQVVFTMSIEGSFDGIISFFKDVENSGYLVGLNQASVTGSGANASGRIDGKVFFTQEVDKNV